MSRESNLIGCAVLFGTPVNREEFDCAARPGSRSDYMTGMLREQDPAAVWISDYESVARAALQLMKTALNLGASVYQRATLRDFADATARFQVVVLFAHWRGAMFRPSDFLGDIGAICDEMDRHPSRT